MPCNPHRMTRTARTRSRKFSGRCESCGKPLCSCRAYQYTDENNGAITANAPYLCRDCYETRYSREYNNNQKEQNKRRYSR